MPGKLGLLTSIANRLLEADASTATEASEQILAQLVEHFDLQYSFLRYSDHGIRASVLAAEWPPRNAVADPDPFAIAAFTSDQPALALCNSGKELVIYRGPEIAGAGSSLTGRRRAGRPLVAAAPLLSGPLTAGVLGFVKFRGRKWKPEALRTLEAVAPLLAQFQARVSAEQRLRHLADHDDLT
ncbi:MAG: GAF domain-containing protein, partial [Mycobacterium sp.]